MKEGLEESNLLLLLKFPQEKLHIPSPSQGSFIHSFINTPANTHYLICLCLIPNVLDSDLVFQEF